MTATGRETPTLVCVRGNSGSGKSTVAAEVRRRYGRGCSLIEQDYLRRVVLREHGSDSTPTKAPAFVMTTARAALDAGYHVVLEGILHTGSYGAPLRKLIAEHPGPSFVFYLDVSFDETLRRHAGRVDLAHVTAQMMYGWYHPLDLLGVPGEQVIDEASTVEQSVSRILHASGLAETAALTPCPLVCPACARKRRSEASTPPAGGETA